MVDTAANEEALKAVNQFRSWHGCNPLVYNADLATEAQKWAEQLLQSECARFNGDEQAGQCIAYHGLSDTVQFTPSDAIQVWYDPIQMFNWEREFTYETCQFTQLIWNDSNQFGLGRAISKDKDAVYMVGFFLPKGNIAGNYKTNVPKLIPEDQRQKSGIDLNQKSKTKTSTRASPSALNTSSSSLRLNETKEQKKQREKMEKTEKAKLDKEKKEREKKEDKNKKEREKMAAKEKKLKEKQEKKEEKERRKSQSSMSIS